MTNQKVIIEHKVDYLHVRQYGTDSYEISLDLWRQIVAACEEYDCYNVLGESYTSEELSTMDAYAHVEIFNLAGVTLRHRIAWVHRGKNAAQNDRFIETTLKNRGMVNGHIFASTEEAKRWLLS